MCWGVTRVVESAAILSCFAVKCGTEVDQLKSTLEILDGIKHKAKYVKLQLRLSLLTTIQQISNVQTI